MQGEQNREFIHCFRWAGRCSATPRKSELHGTPQLLGKTSAITLNVPPSLSLPSFICHMVWNIALWSTVLAVPTPKFLCTPSLLAGRMGWEAGKALRLCKHSLAITKTSLCYQHCFQQNPKHSPMLAALNQISSTPAKTSPDYSIWHLWEWVFSIFTVVTGSDMKTLSLP